MFGPLSCDHGYFQLSPRKVGGGEKERETVTRAPSLEPHGARPGQVTAFFTAWLRRGLLPWRQ